MSDLNQTFQAILREHDDDGIGQSARLYERIDRIVNLFSCGEEYGAVRMSEYLSAAKEELIKDRREDFGGIDDDMEGWYGEAADQFKNYVKQLDDGLNLMVDRIETLQMILQAHQTLVKGMREDVLDLVRKTLDGVEAAETEGWRVGMTVAGAVAAFAATAAAAATGGSSLMVFIPIALDMAAGGSSVAVAVSGAEDELGVLVNFVDSAEGMLHLIDIERLRIEKGFRKLAESVTDGMLTEVRPERPVVVTAPDFRPGSFGMADDVQAGHPVPTDTTDLVPEPKKHPDGPFDRTRDGRDRYPEQGPA